jgi:hypothetical protein
LKTPARKGPAFFFAKLYLPRPTEGSAAWIAPAASVRVDLFKSCRLTVVVPASGLAAVAVEPWSAQPLTKTAITANNMVVMV